MKRRIQTYIMHYQTPKTAMGIAHMQICKQDAKKPLKRCNTCNNRQYHSNWQEKELKSHANRLQQAVACKILAAML